MITEKFQISMWSGVADAVLLAPGGEGPWPGVIHLTDAGGIRPAHTAIAERLAREGFAVLMPNVFYRTSRPPVFEMKPGVSEDAMMKRFAELTAPLNVEALESDALKYIDALTGSPHVIPGSKIGVVGYCFTGAVAMRLAAARPDRIAVVASFHGGRLFTESEDSPHHLLPRIQARLYFAHATKDRSMPEEAIQKFEDALKNWGGRYESETYDGAYHSWTASDSPVYNEIQAARAFDKLVSLLRESLTKS